MALTPAQLADYDRKAGWPPAEIPTAVAVEMAESSGDPTAVGPSYAGDAGSWGLFQVQSGQHPDLVKKYGRRALLSDPLAESKAGLDVFNAEGWSAWSVYKQGTYRKYLKDSPGSTPSSVAAANPGKCGPNGWKDAECGPLDPGCAVQNWYGGVSCSVGNQMGKAQSGLQMLVGLLVLAGAGLIFLYLFATKTDTGRQMVRGAKMAAVAAV